MMQRPYALSGAMMTMVLFATTARAGSQTIGTSAGPRAFGDPFGGLTATEVDRFVAGREAFEEVEDVTDGLGPVFNANSCAVCHSIGGTGGGGTQVETRFGAVTSGVFDPMADHGGSLIQTDGIGAQGTCTFAGEQVPDGATVRAGRRTTPLFGLGLVDAVPDLTFLTLAANQARRQPAIAGRPHVVTDLITGRRAVGRFGWKSQVASLMAFSADAYLNEMGITSPFLPAENCPQGDCAALACDPVADPEDDGEDVSRFDDFMTLLAPPVRQRLDWTRLGGSAIFDQIGCANCHVRTLTTGRSPVAALRYRTFEPFSDFLLHDMGTLGDGITQGHARGKEMRTAPLWGLRLLTTYLHDGRATTLADAILAHDGQGKGARDRFAALPAGSRTRLLAFLAGL